jgi:hypothetical protein
MAEYSEFKKHPIMSLEIRVIHESNNVPVFNMKNKFDDFQEIRGV